MGGGGLVCAEKGVVLPSCRQGLPDAAAYAIRLQRRVRELAGWVVGTQKSLVLPSCRQGLPAADDGGSPPRTLRLQRRVRELAGWVVGTQKKRGAASTVVRGARRRPARLLAEAFGFLDGVGDDVSKSWHWRARAIFWCQQGQDQKHGWLISHLRVRALPALP